MTSLCDVPSDPDSNIEGDNPNALKIDRCTSVRRVTLRLAVRRWPDFGGRVSESAAGESAAFVGRVDRALCDHATGRELFGVVAYLIAARVRKCDPAGQA